MEIKRSKKIANGAEEYRWHYDWTTCTFLDKLIIFLFTFYASHLLFHAAFYSFPLFVLLFFNIISFKMFIVIILIYFSSYFFYKPFQCHNNKLPWYPEWFKKHAFWDWVKFYGDWLVIRRGADELYKDKQFVYCVQPHGILAVNRIQMLGHTWFHEIQPGTFGRYAAATPQFYVPGVRETSLWAAAVDASKRVLNIVLNNDESIYLWVGGTKELLTTDSNSTETKLVVLKRYGFVKLAIINGVDIVPVMQFGEKFIYRMYTFPFFIHRILYKLFKTPGILFFGKIALIPHGKRRDGTPIRMGMVVGEPIKITKIDQDDIDFEKHIKPIHEEYMKRMTYLFETYKKEYHYGDEQTLTFVSASQ